MSDSKFVTNWNKGGNLPILEVLTKLGELSKKIIELEISKKQIAAVGQVKAFAASTGNQKIIDAANKALQAIRTVRDDTASLAKKEVPRDIP
jgi:hypothetical protein